MTRGVTGQRARRLFLSTCFAALLLVPASSEINALTPFAGEAFPGAEGHGRFAAGDGMADAWEGARGLDPAIALSWSDANGNGWRNFDEFLDFAHRSALAGKRIP